MKASAILSAALTTVSAVLVAVGLLWIYFQARVYTPAYIVTNADLHFAKQLTTNSIMIGRWFRITKDTDFTITRELVKRSDNPHDTVRVDLQQTLVHYSRGDYSTQRVIEVPTLIPGPYEILNVVCWDANIARRDCIELPRVVVQIVSGVDP